MRGDAMLNVLAWPGEGPMIGQYVMAKRGRTAYLILEIRLAKPGSKTYGRLRCERTSPARLPKDAVVHGWRWSKR